MTKDNQLNIFSAQQLLVLELAYEILYEQKLKAYNSAEEHQYIDLDWAKAVTIAATTTNDIFHEAHKALYIALEHSKGASIQRNHKDQVYRGGILKGTETHE